MKVVAMPDGRSQFDSGEVQGSRVRRIFETRDAAETLMRRAKTMAKDEGEKLLVEWLSIPPAEIGEIVRYRRAVIELNDQPDWNKGRELHVAQLVAVKKGGKLDEVLKDYIERKRKAGRNKDYVDRIERELGAFVRRYLADGRQSHRSDKIVVRVVPEPILADHDMLGPLRDDAKARLGNAVHWLGRSRNTGER
jgi:hypothetical protein